MAVRGRPPSTPSGRGRGCGRGNGKGVEADGRARVAATAVPAPEGFGVGRSGARDGVRPCGGGSGWRHWGEERVRGWAERLRRVVAVLRGRDLWTRRRGEEEGPGRGARCQWRPRFGCAGEWVRARATALGVVQWMAGRGSGRGLAPRGARSADLVACSSRGAASSHGRRGR